MLVVAALVNPIAPVSATAPEGVYATSAFSAGFLDGYNTMDALASLAFGVIVVSVIRDLGIKHDAAVAGNTVQAGIFSCVFMGLIYFAMTVVGAQSRGLFPVSANGGIALADIAGHYFGTAGQIILAVTVTLACLKTAIGLVTSCAEIFRVIFPKSMSYKAWAIVFSIVSLFITNVGLTMIIGYSVPVLMFLYPLTITLMLLSLFGHFFAYDKRVYVSVTAFTLAAAVLDLLAALPEGARTFLHLDGFVAFCKESLPLFSNGLFWLIPAAVGVVLGFILRAAGKKQTA